MRKYLAIALLALLCTGATGGLFNATAYAADVTSDGKVKVDGLLQFWGINDTTLNYESSGAGTSQPITNFRFRRVELQLSGSVTENTNWLIMVDPSKVIPSTAGSGSPVNDAKILQDAFMNYNVTPACSLTVGQFRVPTTAEGMDPDSELPFPERSMVARNFGEYRDQGAMLTYKTAVFKFAGMIANGHGANSDDFNLNSTTADPYPNRKNLHFRADFAPVDGLSVGAFTTLTNFGYGQKGIWGANLRTTPTDNTFVRVEGVIAKNNVDEPTPFTEDGLVVDGGYTYGDWQPVARFEVQQNATTVPTTLGAKGTQYTGTAWTLGLNYYLAKNKSKIQFAIMGLNKVSGSGGASTATGIYNVNGAVPYGGSLMVLAYQMAF